MSLRKRTAKRLCVTNVTRLRVLSFSSPNINVFDSGLLQKDLFVTPGLPSSFLSRPVVLILYKCSKGCDITVVISFSSLPENQQ